MDIIEFQNKLKEVQTLALNNGKKVKAALVEKFFEGDDITQDNYRRSMISWKYKVFMQKEQRNHRKLQYRKK